MVCVHTTGSIDRLSSGGSATSRGIFSSVSGTTTTMRENKSRNKPQRPQPQLTACKVPPTQQWRLLLPERSTSAAAAGKWGKLRDTSQFCLLRSDGFI